VALAPDGSFSYTPRYHFSGLDSFTYLASNGVQVSGAATVSIDVVETAPVARDVTYTVPGDPMFTTLQHSVLLGATDPDGDPLTAVRATVANQLSTTTHGTLSFNNDGTFTYTPAAGFHGTDSFQYEAFDGLDDSTPAIVTIIVSNQAPAVENAAYAIPTAGATIAAVAGVLATATDPFGYPVTAAQHSAPSDGS
jgi:hypothetical protein